MKVELIWVLVAAGVHLRALKRAAYAPVIAKIFMDTVVALHGLPTSIVSDRDTRFTSAFWQQVTGLLGVKLYIKLFC